MNITFASSVTINFPSEAVEMNENAAYGQVTPRADHGQCRVDNDSFIDEIFVL